MAFDKMLGNATSRTTPVSREISQLAHSSISSEEKDESVFLPAWQASLSILSFVLGLGPVIGLGYTCYAPIAFNIASELDNPALASWCLNAWPLASSFSFLLCGYLSDVCGRRHVLLFGSTLGFLGFVVCSVAHNIATLLAGQALLGMSVGFLLVVYSATVEIIPRAWCPTAIGILECGFMMPWASFAVLISNSLLVRSTWRWIFRIGIILETLASVGIFCFYRPKCGKSARSSLRHIFKSLDYIGLILFTGGLTSVMISLMWAGTSTHRWSSANVVCPFVIGLTSLVGAVTWDAYYAPSPVMPWWLLRQFRSFGALTLIVFTTGITFFPMLSYIPQGLFVMFSNDPIEVGVLSLPATLGQGIGVILGLLLTARLGHFKYQLVFLMAFQMAFKLASIASLNPNRKWAFIFLPALGLSTYGWHGILNITLLSANLPRSILGTAIALNGSMRTAGGAVGGAISRVIFDHVYNKDLTKEVDLVMAQANVPLDTRPEILVACLFRNFSALSKLLDRQPALIGRLVELIQLAFGHALQMVFIAVGAISVLALVTALFVEDRSSQAQRDAVSEEHV